MSKHSPYYIRNITICLFSSSEKVVFRGRAIVEKKKKGEDRKKYFPAKEK